MKYGEADVSNLYFATLSIENTGNRVVQGQRVRLNVEGAKLLKWILDPVPDPERGVGAETDADSSDLILIIGHLERRQSVNLKVALSAAEVPKIKLVPHNPQGDVEFISRSIKNRDDELVPLSRAIALVGALLVLPGIVRPLPGGDYISVALQLALLIALLPYAPKIIKAVALRLSARGRFGGASVNHALWMADGSIRADHMAIGPSSSIVVHTAPDPTRIHPGIILLRDAVMQHLGARSDFTRILAQLADASKELQAPVPDPVKLRQLLEGVRASFAGMPQEPYVAGVVATTLMQVPSRNA
ncbi:hypothetical protein [Nonomuraea indica]|uniref:Uncharacterized protein n=1 Tax=Nonomuraea indica TaxID=1581193 RepID=A0ABW8A0N3_9ACTN